MGNKKKRGKDKKLKKSKEQSLARGPIASDEQLDYSLTSNHRELAHHSLACWEFAFKMYEKRGRGCIFWLFPTYGKSILPIKASFPVQYKTIEECVQMEYPPVVKFVKAYDPHFMFVSLVAIRTGDERDSLMKAFVVERGAETAPDFSDAPKEETLQFYVGAAPTMSTPVQQRAMPSGSSLPIPRGCGFCANPLCLLVEPKPGAFRLCSRCRARRYCSPDCQKMHWKSAHKKACNDDKERADKYRKYQESLKVQRLVAQAENKSNAFATFPPQNGQGVLVDPSKLSGSAAGKDSGSAAGKESPQTQPPTSTPGASVSNNSDSKQTSSDAPAADTSTTTQD